jgi:bifunctional DNA-binding transcriptional regulator/antitoxin component of YhaV-PrlF toxin-antitoxin module
LSAPTPPPSLYYTVSPIDARGRLADRSPVRALGWRPDQPITITVRQQAIVVTPQAGGADSITRQGHLRLPARIRHIYHLNTGDRLLVAVAPTPGVLVAYTVALLESILLEHHATASSAEAAR